jgi:exopolyphosphatase/guanosine-5'-triphosphate,3'-diphosphate pyrophosphatase
MDTASSTPAPHEDASPPERPRQVAVVDVGARAIRLDISEIAPGGGMRLLESVQQAVSLGKNTFGAGSIDRESIEECVTILKGFRQVMAEYGITAPDQIRAVATSSVREAANREAFLDRIYIATGISVEVLEDAEVEHLIHVATHGLFETIPALNSGEVLIVEVGGGATRLLLIQDGYVTYSGTYKLGALRMQETLETSQTPYDRLCAVLDQHIQRTINQMKEMVPAEKVPCLIALAGDMETAMRRLITGWDDDDTARVNMARFTLAEKIVSTPPEKLMQKHHLPPQEAETAGQALLIYDRIARAFGVKEMLVSTQSMRRGLLMKMAGISVTTARYAEQLAHSAATLGRKYHFDEKHSTHVADLSLMLFRALRADHGLGPQAEILLRTAGLLHDIGAFVSNNSHHKHSMYLILNSELFGLTRRDNTMVALIARYHRRSVPRLTHPEYAALDRDSRLVVAKLAAILRVADAMDRSHLQHIRDITCSREERRFVLTVPDVEDVTLERLAVKEKGTLFESIFGLQVILRTAQTQKGSLFDG